MLSIYTDVSQSVLKTPYGQVGFYLEWTNWVSTHFSWPSLLYVIGSAKMTKSARAQFLSIDFYGYQSMHRYTAFLVAIEPNTIHEEFFVSDASSQSAATIQYFMYIVHHCFILLKKAISDKQSPFGRFFRRSFHLSFRFRCHHWPTSYSHSCLS